MPVGEWPLQTTSENGSWLRFLTGPIRTALLCPLRNGRFTSKTATCVQKWFKTPAGAPRELQTKQFSRRRRTAIGVFIETCTKHLGDRFSIWATGMNYMPQNHIMQDSKIQDTSGLCAIYLMYIQRLLAVTVGCGVVHVRGIVKY